MPSILSSGPAGTGVANPSSAGHSAPVIEFICLFTHDLKRKQKRWEDGRLKYHTFNKRVMVYDERGNFVGDMHWQREWDFDEGEEVRLERGGIIVQVVECIGRQEQDLTELLDKRVKEKEERQQARTAMRPSPSTSSAQTPLNHFQTRHRPLHHVLGTPTGHHGRAVVPAESPFELRQQAAETTVDRTDPRPLKRRRCDTTPPVKMGYAQQLFGATLSLSAVPLSSAPPRRLAVPSYRLQTEPPSSLEEKRDNQQSANRSRALPAGDVSLETSTREAVDGRQSKSSLDADREDLREDREVPEPAPRPLHRSHQVRAIPSLLKQVSRLSDARDSHQPTVANKKGPTKKVKPRTISSTRFEESSNAQAMRGMGLVDGVENDTSSVDILESGGSRSQAIVLDEEPGFTSDGAEQVPQPPKKATRTNNSKRPATTTKQKPAKRAKPSVPGTRSTGPHEAPEEPCREERTELRLKPRQKRGLLLLSEKKRNKPKQPLRRQEDFSREETPAQEPEEAPDRVLGAGNPLSPSQDDNPFASLPADPKDIALFPPLSELQPAWPMDDPGSDDACLPQHDTTPDQAPDMAAVTTHDPPDSRNLKHGGLGISEEAEADSSPPPRARRARQQRRGSQPPTQPGNSLGSELQEPVVMLSLEPAKPKRTRQSRTKKNADDESSNRQRRRVLREDSEESGHEEPSPAPVAPRLARLSRKGLRSREIIGFLPSSSPVVDTSLSKRLPPTPHTPHSAADETGGVQCFSEPACKEPPTADNTSTKPAPDISQNALPLPIARRDVTASLQRHSSLPNGRESVTMISDAEDAQEAISTAKLTDAPAKQRGLARHNFVIFPTGSVGNSTIATLTPISAVQGIAAAEKKAAPPTAASREDHQETPPAFTPAVKQHLHELPNHTEKLGDPIAHAGDIGPPSCVTETNPANKELPDAPPAVAGRPTIVNPATRGRKAALKSHAAGQAPQSILPTEPAPGTRVGMRPPAAMVRQDSAGTERPKRTMRFPGFASAKEGGPWSREAHDLLESGRPGEDGG